MRRCPRRAPANRRPLPVARLAREALVSRRRREIPSARVQAQRHLPLQDDQVAELPLQTDQVSQLQLQTGQVAGLQLQTDLAEVPEVQAGPVPLRTSQADQVPEVAEVADVAEVAAGQVARLRTNQVAEP